MAFMYPFHAPIMPMKWDDALWVQEVCPSMEHTVLTTIEVKRTVQCAIEQMRYINDASFGLRVDDIDEEEEDSGDDH
ncbi:hypothetical protein KIN20_015513 [Parelaphostrongylus tenuis]|uniref:Uncharacterized protein n=1 Tax=Parelaphostrongylus tenuis TaxID=148309 RepID=A0AAD5MF21_PARTN|nr:hypothetical protein KIN20_015513 [Parelaphostrongylus tenuis]